ncbi:MAG: DUF349 domain-containing protein [Bacteroidetes bacterium]|nr:DUF349 domain-containing protein [Bacteroidota bacterium]
MKKAENTHQIPEQEISIVQEENSSPVEKTELLTDNNLPTDENQVTEEKSKEEFPQEIEQPEVKTSVEITPDEKPEIVSEIKPEEGMEKIPEEIPEEIPEKSPEEILKKITEKKPEKKQKEISPVESPEISAEVTDDQPAETPIVEPVEIHAEVIEDQSVETSFIEPLEINAEVTEDQSVETSFIEPVGISAEVTEDNPVPVEAKTVEEETGLAIPELHEDTIEPLEEDLQIAAEEEAKDTSVDYDSHTREELVEMLQEAVTQEDINSVKNRIALIKVAFIRKKKEENLLLYQQFLTEGGTKEDFAANQDPLEERFNEIFNIYKANKARYTEEQEKIKLNNLKKKQEILDELKQLVSSEETLKKTYDEFKALQERWKGIGMVPRTEINNLWQNYHFLVEKFFDKVKLNKELKDLDLKKNLEAKMSLCEKTEELLLETSILRSFKKLQKYHEEWKELGPVPADKKDEIWERFKNTSDKINDRRREHYTQIEDEQQKNLETKTALCEQGEEILNAKVETIKEWQEFTNKVNELLIVWKSVGPVPQKVNTEIWNRFKTSLDAFFSTKKDFFDKLKDQQVHNYNLKVDLCVQAEALKTSNDWKKTSNDLIRLQNEWKNIGPVPKKHSDKIWKRFRAACDEFFTAKSSYFSNVRSNEGENLNKKTDLINRLKEFQATEDKNQNLEMLKNFQREWTEIGHIPIKEKDKLQNEYRAIINQHLDKLKISEFEISAVNFQNRIENLKNDPNSRRLIGREKDFLAGKISKLKEDVNLWENNIGFLADSKNAAILKEEFTKKINKAKSELKVMEAKFKILRSQ